MNFTGLRGLIFDCDGVLLNSRPANTAFYNYLRARASLPPLNPAEEEYVHMSTYAQALEFIYRGLGRARRKEALAGALDELDHYMDYYSLVRVEEGLIPLLDWLHGGGIPLAVCTNRLSPLEDLLARFRLEKYFRPVQTASNSLPKPSPDGIMQVLQAWGMRPDEVAYIGDSQVDAQAAEAAGVRFWAFKNQGLAAGAHVEGFSTLHSRWRLELEASKRPGAA